MKEVITSKREIKNLSSLLYPLSASGGGN